MTRPLPTFERAGTTAKGATRCVPTARPARFGTFLLTLTLLAFLFAGAGKTQQLPPDYEPPDEVWINECLKCTQFSTFVEYHHMSSTSVKRPYETLKCTGGVNVCKDGKKVRMNRKLNIR